MPIVDPEVPERVVRYPCPLCQQPTLEFGIEWDYEDNSESYYTPSFWIARAYHEVQACDCLIPNEDIGSIETCLDEYLHTGDLRLTPGNLTKVYDWSVYGPPY